MTKLLAFHDLVQRHPGLTQAVSDMFAEATRVCLDRHHVSPVEILIEASTEKQTATANWVAADERTRGAWANDIDTTATGAYCLALAALEIAEGFVAMRRAETLTGADYYVAPPAANTDDLESWFRLEVSGTDKGDGYSVKQRLREKVRQALAGASNLPAIAAVVGFRLKLVAITRAEES